MPNNGIKIRYDEKSNTVPIILKFNKIFSLLIPTSAVLVMLMIIAKGIVNVYIWA